jgi:biotin transporter BioY
MTWVQAVSGWALGYVIVPFICGCFVWEAQDEFWKGFYFGLGLVTFILVCVTLGLLSSGWLPSWG